MKHDELIAALRRLKVETGSLACLGCGHEHNCGTQGCAILRAAVEELENTVVFRACGWRRPGMADLIERAAALNALCETAELGGCVEHPKNNGFCKPGNRYCDEGKALDSIPAASVAASRRSSAWIWSPDGERVCMTCGGPASFTLTGTGWIEAPYCQTCGARMNWGRKDVDDG